MKIQDTVALVTGANRGLGLAFAKGLLAAGARKVYAAARDPHTVDIPGVIVIKLDVTNADDIARAARELRDVNVLINNAGIAQGDDILSANALATARAHFETNVFGPLALSQAFAPTLAYNGGGAIVNVLSALSWISFPSVPTYSASKSAMWSLTNGLRNGLRAQKTQVVGVHVGYMDTDMASHVTGPKTKPQDVVAQVITALVEGRDEVLADEVSRQVKGGLSAEPGAYLGAAG